MQQSAPLLVFAIKSARTRQHNGWFKRCGSSAECLNKGNAIRAVAALLITKCSKWVHGPSTLLSW